MISKAEQQEEELREILRNIALSEEIEVLKHHMETPMLTNEQMNNMSAQEIQLHFDMMAQNYERSIYHPELPRTGPPPPPLRPLVSCPICEIPKEHWQFSKFTDCSHSSCQECTNSFLMQRIQNNEIDIACFVSQSCKKKLDERSAAFENLPYQIRYLYFRCKNDKMVLSDPNLTFCPRIECETILRKEEGSDIWCPVCDLVFCPKCLETSHEGPCDTKLATKVLENYKYRKCPFCNLIVEKTHGCKHIKCACTKEFCYDCGMVWTSGHSCQKVFVPPAPIAEQPSVKQEIGIKKEEPSKQCQLS